MAIRSHLPPTIPTDEVSPFVSAEHLLPIELGKRGRAHRLAELRPLPHVQRHHLSVLYPDQCSVIGLRQADFTHSARHGLGAGTEPPDYLAH